MCPERKITLRETKVIAEKSEQRVRTFEDKNSVLCSCNVTSSGMSGTNAPNPAMNKNATHCKRTKIHSLVDRL